MDEIEPGYVLKNGQHDYRHHLPIQKGINKLILIILTLENASLLLITRRSSTAN